MKNSSDCETAHKISLLDLLFEVPDLLLQHLLNVWPTRGRGIRVLRLVSKEVGSIAQQAIQSCTVDLKSWDDSSSQTVVRLLGDARLKLLDITFHITEGQIPFQK